MGKYTFEQVESVLMDVEARYLEAEDMLRDYASILREREQEHAVANMKDATLLDKVEFALRDAGFDLDTALELATKATSQPVSVPPKKVVGELKPEHLWNSDKHIRDWLATKTHVRGWNECREAMILANPTLYSGDKDA